MNYFVTGIDTDSGKTLVSAILCEGLEADYWKPIQAGFPADSETLSSLISNAKTVIHKEAYILKTPASPHAAARVDGIEIRLSEVLLPVTSNHLIIEGAGGCLVPLNDVDFVIDLPPRLDAEVVVVADLYLGSINHTLLTVNELKRRNIKIKGIVFNGDSNAESERIILHHTRLNCLLRIQKEKVINKEVVKKYAKQLLNVWYG
jgi:dethiobiotin synthetase